MIKVRMQGTKEDMKWLEDQLRTKSEVLITESSEAFQNKGTNRYFRRYLEIERKDKNKMCMIEKLKHSFNDKELKLD